ncbi:PRC-barrel domain-containing protein [Pelagovum pacificum]|uniref:PRC-barrel domain-containing protein n=1 Tax=Pelagovum pacificum TaxID=2588711 RepID=A0A5C5GDB7_9RHOB|nr:PRC-barrel domain-containing protein [Pelagovum pacificum]QQA42446.1 PRC-barrel domain-containing protein [Pelagovum pacificum]TNY31529.1 hypothetical protein FHY64_16095 [Pelagovum pacificum]
MQVVKTFVSAALIACALPAIAQETAVSGIGSVDFEASDYLGTTLLNQRLYATGGEGMAEDAAMAQGSWKNIGEIHDLVISEDGTVKAAIVGVGGFLGIGEKDVAIALDRIARTVDEAGQTVHVVDVTTEELQAAAAFEGLPEIAPAED